MLEHFKAIWEFLVVTVLLKALVAHSIVNLLDKWVIKPWFGSTPRKEAIWLHYQSKAAGLGHEKDDVMTCGQDHCKVFA